MMSNTSSIKGDSVKSGKWIAVLLALVAMTGAGALGVAAINDPNNTVPIVIGDSVTSSGHPVQFDIDNEAALDVTGANAIGDEVITRQKIIINFVLDVSEDANIVLPLENLSADQRVIKIKATAPSELILDVEPGTGTSAVRLLGENEWIFAIASGAGKTLNVEVSATDPGFFSLILELSDP